MIAFDEDLLKEFPLAHGIIQPFKKERVVLHIEDKNIIHETDHGSQIFS